MGDDDRWVGDIQFIESGRGVFFLIQRKGRKEKEWDCYI